MLDILDINYFSSQLQSTLKFMLGGVEARSRTLRNVVDKVRKLLCQLSVMPRANAACAPIFDPAM